MNSSTLARITGALLVVQALLIFVPMVILGGAIIVTTSGIQLWMLVAGLVLLTRRPAPAPAFARA